MPIQQQKKDVTTSSHHIPQRKFKKLFPPTLSRSWKVAATFISVAAPIGQQPMYKLVTGFLNKEDHVPGCKVYFAMERRRKKTKRKRLRKKST